MRYLTEHVVVPYLKKRIGPQGVLVTRMLRTVALGESAIDRQIADLEISLNPTVGLSAHPGQTDVRIVAKASTSEEAEALVADFESKIRDRLGDAIYATGNATLAEVIASLFQERGASLAVAETVTHGDIVRRLSAHPEILRGGGVSPTGAGLAHLLDLDLPTEEGESAAVILSEGVRNRWAASLGLAVVGDEESGPWVAIANEDGVDTRQLRFRGRGHRARVWTTTLALEFMRRTLLGRTAGWAE